MVHHLIAFHDAGNPAAQLYPDTKLDRPHLWMSCRVLVYGASDMKVFHSSPSVSHCRGAKTTKQSDECFRTASYASM